MSFKKQDRKKEELMKEFETFNELIDFIDQRLDRLGDVQISSNGRFINLSYRNVARVSIFINSKFEINLGILDQFEKNVERYKEIERYLPHQRQLVESQDFEDHSVYYIKCSDELKFIIKTKEKSITIDAGFDIYADSENEKLTAVRLKMKNHYREPKEIPSKIMSLIDSVQPSNLSVRNRI